MIKKELGTFARILIDVDFSKYMPDEILIQRERFEFLIAVEYENFPHYYRQCNAVAHDISHCRFVRREDGGLEHQLRLPVNQNRRARQELAREVQQPEEEHDDKAAAINTILQVFDDVFAHQNVEP